MQLNGHAAACQHQVPPHRETVTRDVLTWVSRWLSGGALGTVHAGPGRALFVPLTASVCRCKALRRGITTVCTLDRTMPLAQACSRADCKAALVCKCDDNRRPLPAPLRLVP